MGEVDQRGTDHTIVGSQLLERWDFSEVLVDSIRHHHDPELAGVDPLLTWALNMAENLTERMGMDAQDAAPCESNRPDEDALSGSGLEATAIEEACEKLRSELEGSRSLIEIS